MAPVSQATFPKNARLLQTGEFRSLINDARKISAKAFLVRYKKHPLEFSRLGILVAKKKFHGPWIEIS